MPNVAGIRQISCHDESGILDVGRKCFQKGSESESDRKPWEILRFRLNAISGLFCFVCGSSLLCLLTACIRSYLGRTMAMEAALSMLDGREFEVLLAVIFSMGIFVGFVLSQIFCKSCSVNATINRKERRSHGDEEGTS